MSLWLKSILTTITKSVEYPRYIFSIMKRPHELENEDSPEAKVSKVGDVVLDGTRGFRKCAILMIYSGTGYFGMQKWVF